MTKPCERHGNKVCYECVVVTDAAKSMFNIVNSYVAFVPRDQLTNSYVAIRLSDGGHDGNLYTSKRDAVKHQLDEFQCAYFSYRNSPNGFANVKEAQVFLDWNRMAYDSGYRLPDPDAKSGGQELIMPLTQEHTYAALHPYLRKIYG